MTHEQLMQLRHILWNKGYDDSMILLLLTVEDIRQLIDFEREHFYLETIKTKGYPYPEHGDTGYVMGIRYLVTDEIPHSRYRVRSPSGRYILEEGWI